MCVGLLYVVVARCRDLAVKESSGRPSPLPSTSTRAVLLVEGWLTGFVRVPLCAFLLLMLLCVPPLAQRCAGYSDPHCIVTLGNSSRKTHTIENSTSPVWNEVRASVAGVSAPCITCHG